VRDRVLYGDALVKLRELPDECVHMCVTSPPYYKLRDFHHDDQVGLEHTPDLYVERLVDIFREVRRVLRRDGTFWLDIGDSYAGTGECGRQRLTPAHNRQTGLSPKLATRGLPSGVKTGDLYGIPWMVARALRDDGWWLRAENIWDKVTGLPESVGNRTTRGHEQVFQFAKSQKYFFDAFAISEPATSVEARLQDAAEGFVARRNRRSVWRLGPDHYYGSHTAPFPRELAEICIRAGSSERGACATCGSPVARVTEKLTFGKARSATKYTPLSNAESAARSRQAWRASRMECHTAIREVGWRATCDCRDPRTLPSIILDPFAGSGTTLQVARWLGRHFIGVELNQAYEADIQGRLQVADFRVRDLEAFRLMVATARTKT